MTQPTIISEVWKEEWIVGSATERAVELKVDRNKITPTVPKTKYLRTSLIIADF
ncbi:MAG: hypothetical protein WC749_15945 [Dehalococcoidia bacterium]